MCFHNSLSLSDYSHALRDNNLRHIRNSHGENTNEKYPVTKEDLSKIPDIVANYDKVVVFKKSPTKVGLMYVKVSSDGLVYYLEQVTTKYGNEKLLINKQMIKTGIYDIPDIKGLKDAIIKKESAVEFLADLKARQVYAQSVYQTHSTNNISQNSDLSTQSEEKSSTNYSVGNVYQAKRKSDSFFTERYQAIAFYIIFFLSTRTHKIRGG